MQYLLMICSDEQKMSALSEQELAKRMEGWTRLTTDLRAANKFVSAERLRPVATATTLRIKGGQRVLSDGPYAETKEQLGGYYLIEAKDLDEATEWAAKMPHLADAGAAVEIRPTWEM
jgi:hypothetical protein